MLQWMRRSSAAAATEGCSRTFGERELRHAGAGAVAGAAVAAAAGAAGFGGAASSRSCFSSAASSGRPLSEARRWRTSAAASGCPCSRSQSGDRAAATTPTAARRRGSDDRGELQPPAGEWHRRPAGEDDETVPALQNQFDRLTMRPRDDGGAISVARQSGGMPAERGAHRRLRDAEHPERRRRRRADAGGDDQREREEDGGPAAVVVGEQPDQRRRHARRRQVERADQRRAPQPDVERDGGGTASGSRARWSAPTGTPTRSRAGAARPVAAAYPIRSRSGSSGVASDIATCASCAPRSSSTRKLPRAHRGQEQLLACTLAAATLHHDLPVWLRALAALARPPDPLAQPAVPAAGAACRCTAAAHGEGPAGAARIWSSNAIGAVRRAAAAPELRRQRAVASVRRRSTRRRALAAPGEARTPDTRRAASDSTGEEPEQLRAPRGRRRERKVDGMISADVNLTSGVASATSRASARFGPVQRPARSRQHRERSREQRAT